MFFIIYISTSVKLMSQDELAALLLASRNKNTAIGITGVLMYSQGTFIQTIEGEKEAIEKIYGVIQKDPRHKNLIELISGEMETRVFADWSMAYITKEPDKMALVDGYQNPLRKKLFANEKEGTIINVLRTFADNNNLTYLQHYSCT